MIDDKYDVTDIKKKPLPDNKTVRGFTIYNCGIFERLSDGTISGISVAQCDFKIKVPAFMITTFLPSQTKAWYQNITKHYMKHFK